jgi:glycosyltransferase involved in cell wall biosynthesis
MRLLLTADPFLPVPPRLYGGIERIIAALATGLRGAGHTVALVAHPDSDLPVDAFFPWPRNGGLLAHAATLRRAVAAFGPDLVHSFSRLAYLWGLAGGRQPLLMSYQRHPSARTTAWTQRLLGERLAFTGCSDYIAALGRRGSRNWTAIPNFVELERYDFSPRVADDAPLLFLSRLDAIKAPHLAIDIARAAGRRIIVAGNAPSAGPDLAYFENEVRPRLDAPDVDFVGPVDDRRKNALLGAAAALLVPIQWDEPFGIVFAEALACGTPVLATPRGAVPEIVVDGVHGFHIDTFEAGVAAIARLPEIDRRACRERAERDYSAAAVIPRYVATYADRLDEARGRRR